MAIVVMRLDADVAAVLSPSRPVMGVVGPRAIFCDVKSGCVSKKGRTFDVETSLLYPGISFCIMKS
ncbi:hypothetical protein [Tepidimonas charontis]|uniref:hypothetical protein n=1 Tax=Tepidimonas charontis TaxID=2267262 RepID=UPI001185425A|nr:hypothetical protein [Tepidimonas charontis]